MTCRPAQLLSTAAVQCASSAPRRGRGLIGCLSLTLCILLLASCSFRPAPAEPGGYQHLAVSPSAHSYHPPSSIGLPVSIAQIDAEHFLLADTADVFLLSHSATAYSVTKLLPPPVTTWNPTGLAYREGVLYVANNRGANILKLGINGDALALEQQITSPTLRTPQSLVVEHDGGLGVADTDGGGVETFTADGHSRWRLQLDSAHGITESAGYIYASSLAGRRIAKIDLAGHLLQVAGGLGGSVGRYLWPVGLADSGAGVIVTDALSGRISMLDPDLRTVRYAGSNGPGLDAFNFPSTTLPATGGYLVVDTYKRRLVRLSRSWSIQEQIALGSLVPVGRERPQVYVTDGSAYAYGQRPRVYVADRASNPPLPGVDVVAALGLRSRLDFAGTFAGLDHFSPDGRLTQLDFNGSQVQYSGLTWAQRVSSVIAVGSPESSALEVIDPATGMSTSVDIGLDTWWMAGRLMYPDNILRELSDVVQPAQDKFSSARQLLAQGDGRQEALAAALGRQASDWSADLTSEPAQQFWHSGMTKADASRYFDWAVQQPQERVAEILAVRYLSG